jgi:hypothetical protein
MSRCIHVDRWMELYIRVQSWCSGDLVIAVRSSVELVSALRPVTVFFFGLSPSSHKFQSSVSVSYTRHKRDYGHILSCVGCHHKYRPDDGGSMDLWNVHKLIPVYTALQPSRQPSSYSPPREPQIVFVVIFSWDKMEISFSSMVLNVLRVCGKREGRQHRPRYLEGHRRNEKQ